MIHHVKYLGVVLRHKWYVFQAGRKLRVPLWQLIIHDWTKFSPAEWGPYARRFGAGRAGVQDKALDPQEFRDAWKHHWHNNPHHWEFWTKKNLDHYGSKLGYHALGPYDSTQQAWLMPEQYVREMVADWTGASRAYTGKPDCSEWYNTHREKIRVHPRTRVLAEQLIKELKCS